MQPILIFDFADLPQNTSYRQTVAVEQLGILCGLNRRISRRLAKTVFLILSHYPLESLVENSVHFVPVASGWALGFEFITQSDGISPAGDKSRGSLKSIRRAGEKLEHFELSGLPDEGMEVSFRQTLSPQFAMPAVRELKQWSRIISHGDWENAFSQLNKTYAANRLKIQQLQDGISIRRKVLESEGGPADVILSLVASKTDNAVMILDDHCRLDWVNQAFFQLTGVDVTGESKIDVTDVLFHGGDATDAIREFRDAVSKGTSFSFEFVWHPATATAESQDTKPQWIEFQMTPVRDEDNAIVRWIAIGADVTQRRQAALAMEAARNVAESASRAKSEFLAMMSHEIRTPMNAILGMTELALGTELTIDQREYLTTANNSAQALLQILNDVLDLSKVEARRLELDHRDFNLADLVRETVDTMTVLAQKKDLRLSCDFPWNIPQYLCGDLVRVRQILVNLIGNAIKFTRTGSVSVEVELTDDSNARATVHFRVRDTGIGIAEEKISRIFEAFYQTDASVTRHYGGTGLGLAITAELVRLMGGRIWAESIFGKGSTFHFVVTFPKSKKSMIGVNTAVAQVLRDRSVLVVCDEAQARHKLSNWIQAWGARTRCATSLGEVVDHSCDIVLLDADSCGTEVWDFAANLRQQSIRPVILFSAGNRASSLAQCRERGLEAYLIKPVSPRSLSIALQQVSGQPVARFTTDDLQEGIARTNQSGQVQGASLEHTSDPVRVLIVDDHGSNRALISEVLRRRGHQWQEATSGQQALDMIQEQEFDIVLMDVEMPEMDGLETTARIRALPYPVSSIPVVAVTAYVTDQDRQRCLDASMNDYLAKPINVIDLLEKIERWGRTVAPDDSGGSMAENLEEQLLIQDAPDWATRITRTIVAADGDGQQKEDTETTIDTWEEEFHPFTAALTRFGGDEQLLRMQMDFFLDGTPLLMQKIQEAIQQRDARSLLHHAHRLKSLVSNFDHEMAVELLTNLEEMGRTESLDKATVTLALLESLIEDLHEKIAAY